MAPSEPKALEAREAAGGERRDARLAEVVPRQLELYETRGQGAIETNLLPLLVTVTMPRVGSYDGPVRTRLMPAVLCLVVVSTDACRSPSRSGPDPVAKSASNDCGATRDSSIDGASVAPTIQGTTVDRALAQALGSALSGRIVLVKDWPARPGLSVALVHGEPDEITSGRDLDAHVVLLRHAGAGVEVVATTTFVPEVDTDPAWHVRSPELDLDFARYELREGDMAFGVRLGLTVEFPAGENDSRTLYLFRPDGAELVEVLHTRVQETDEQRGPNELRESTRIVAVAPETTGGFHDLLVHAQWTLGPLVTDDPHPQQRKGHSSQRWRWDGRRYGSPSE